jgi:hypothetical protein
LKPVRKRVALVLGALSLFMTPPPAASAQNAPFDLTGPGLQIMVDRAGKTLPITQVPNLAAGDRIRIDALLPADQGARYLMVAAFLRGATNPPPKSWFFRAETWQKKKSGLDIVVPEGAHQLVLFLAPSTGGDFGALIDAVRGQPGAFVRATQDLNQASLDRTRLDAFVEAIRRQDRTRPENIEAVSPILTHSLAIKLNKECLDQAADVQAACLTQSRESLVLADGHTSSLTETLASTTTDLALQFASTPEGGYGYYSSYIGVVRDIARVFGAFQSTHFQYIPALSRFQGERIGLVLNAAPSFDKPKSALVIAMPAIEPGEAPPLRAIATAPALCAARPGAVLAAEGAPLVYATGYAHDMALRVKKSDGGLVELPVRADAERGGYVIGDAGWQLADFGPWIDGTLHGTWGFTPFDGPRFRLQNPQGQSWRPADDGETVSIVTGRDNGIDLQGGASACVEGVMLRDAAGATQALGWKADGASKLSLQVPRAAAKRGKMTLLVREFGAAAPREIPVSVVPEAARLEAFKLYAGDGRGVLSGNRLDMVSSLSFDGLSFRPDGLERSGKTDLLTLAAADAEAATGLTAGQEGTARVTLADGRKLSVGVTVAAARPKARLIARTVARAATGGALPIALRGDEALTQDARLTFSIGAAPGARFNGTETIEIATADGRASAVIGAKDGLTPQSVEVLVTTVEPGKLLGTAAYGPLRFRLIQDGVPSDWIPLASLVRLPVLTRFACDGAKRTCQMSGRDLFLIGDAARDEAFTDAVAVPDGFTGTALTVPAGAGRTLYLRLRDDPAIVASVSVP